MTQDDRGGKNVPVAVRLPPSAIQRIDDLRPLFPGAAGERTTRSDVLRRMIADGFLSIEPSVINAIDALRGGSSRGEVLSRIIELGIKSMTRKSTRKSAETTK